jgi:hypothetical protein
MIKLKILFNRILQKIDGWVIPTPQDKFPDWMKVNTFDCDGVVFINKEIGGVHPGKNDIIITGRSYEEKPETMRMLRQRRIFNPVFFNHVKFDEKSRKQSGEHKAETINLLLKAGFKIGCHFEDDELQAEVIKEQCPGVPVILLVHPLTNKENVRHLEY